MPLNSNQHKNEIYEYDFSIVVRSVGYLQGGYKSSAKHEVIQSFNTITQVGVVIEDSANLFRGYVCGISGHDEGWYSTNNASHLQSINYITQARVNEADFSIRSALISNASVLNTWEIAHVGRSDWSGTSSNIADSSGAYNNGTGVGVDEIIRLNPFTRTGNYVGTLDGLTPAERLDQNDALEIRYYMNERDPLNGQYDIASTCRQMAGTTTHSWFTTTNDAYRYTNISFETSVVTTPATQPARNGAASGNLQGYHLAYRDDANVHLIGLQTPNNFRIGVNGADVESLTTVTSYNYQFGEAHSLTSNEAIFAMAGYSDNSGGAINYYRFNNIPNEDRPGWYFNSATNEWRLLTTAQPDREADWPPHGDGWYWVNGNFRGTNDDELIAQGWLGPDSNEPRFPNGLTATTRTRGIPNWSGTGNVYGGGQHGLSERYTWANDTATRLPDLAVPQSSGAMLQGY